MKVVETGRPVNSEYASAFERYLARVPETEILPALERQIQEVSELLTGLSEQDEQFRYAQSKWSIREVLGHIIDTERVLGYRALCISRGEIGALPAFDENTYAENSLVHQVPLSELLREFEYLRRSHLLFFEHLSREGMMRLGTANDNPLSVRAAAYVMVGHLRHHVHVLRERYFAALQS